MHIKKACVVGLGLIGGSIAKALKQKLNIEVYGIDINPKYIKSAFAEGIIHNMESNYSYLGECDIVFLCYPVLECIKALPDIIAQVKDGCIITDVGSTKNRVVSYAKSVVPKDIHFIGGHPMAGSEKNGYGESRSHLFENAYYILTPFEDTDKTVLHELKTIVEGFGAYPIIVNAEEHDFFVGAISHTPHIIASALVNTVKGFDTRDSILQNLAAGGFKDITRIASSTPVMWQNICIENGNNISRLLDEYIKELSSAKDLIVNNKSHELHSFFEGAKRYRDNISDNTKGSLVTVYNLYVDVEDKPGVIGKIATLLGNNSVNISNIGISNSREHQLGCLVISFLEKEHFDAAIILLEKSGYKVEV